MNRLFLTSVAGMHGYNPRVEYESEVKQLLPLPPATLHMLLALADEDRLGYAINREPASSLGIALESGKTLSLSNTRI